MLGPNLLGWPEGGTLDSLADLYNPVPHVEPASATFSPMTLTTLSLPPIRPNILLYFALNPIGKSHYLKGTDQEAHGFHPSQE